MRFECRNVAVSRIDERDDTYRITTDRPLEDLTASIRDLGILRAPIVRGKGEAYQVVSGFRRLDAARRLGFGQVPARVIDPDAGSQECLKVAVAENAMARPLNLIEQSRAVSKLARHIPQEHRLAEAAGRLGLPADAPFLKRILPLCGLAQKVQQGVIDGAISLAMALELGRLDPEEADRFAGIFQDLNLSLGKQREILLLVTEIARRDRTAMLAVLEAPPVAGVLNHPDLDSGRKARELRAHLKRRRFPTIARVEEEFADYVRELKLGQGVQLVAPADFEGTVYSLRIDFTSLSDLDAKRQVLEKIVQTPFFDKIAP